MLTMQAFRRKALRRIHTLSDLQKVTVIGAGLAGSEAAWQIAKQGVPVVLYEMRPVRKTPAHITDKFAELVCSNSLRANGLTNAVGVLKEEMRMLDSLILSAADRNAVPAGGALAVDRDGFSGEVTEKLRSHPLIEVKSLRGKSTYTSTMRQPRSWKKIPSI